MDGCLAPHRPIEIFSGPPLATPHPNVCAEREGSSRGLAWSASSAEGMRPHLLLQTDSGGGLVIEARLACGESA